MLRKKRYKTYLIILLLIVISISHWKWFFDYSILTYGDWSFFFKDTQKELVHLISLWNNYSNFGITNIGISASPYILMYSILANIASFAVTERLVFLWPSIIISCLSSYFLVKKITKSEIASVIGSFVFSYNTYLILGRTGHLTLMVSFALAPLIILLYIKTLEQKKYHLAIITGLFCFFASFYEIRAFYIIALVLFLYFFYYLFIIEKLQIKQVIKNSILGFLPFIIVILLNSYWLISIKSTAFSSTEILSRGLFGNSFMNIIQALALFHPFWTGSGPSGFAVQPLPSYFFIIPIAAILGIWLNRKNKNIIFFGIIALVGILLTKQAGEPFPNLYQWLYNYLPGFNAFREASKFYFLIALSYSVLIGAFITWLWKNWTKTKWQIYGKYILTIIIAFIFLWNIKPLITTEIKTLFVSRKIPNDYIILKDFILKQRNYFRTFWTPTNSRWSIYTNNHPKVSNVLTIQDDWKNFYSNKKNQLIQKKIVNIYKKSFSEYLLNNSSSKYIIIPIQDTDNDDDFFRHYGKSRQFYIDQLNKISFLKKINIGTKELAIFENKNYLPHIYTSNQLTYSQSPPDFLEEIFKFNNYKKNNNQKSFFFKETENLNAENIFIPIYEEEPENKKTPAEMSEQELKEYKKQQKLGDNLELKHYKLKIPENNKYLIYIKKKSILANNLDNLKINFNNLTIKKQNLKNKEKKFHLFAEEKLEAGEYEIKISYQGQNIPLIASNDIVLLKQGEKTEKVLPKLEYSMISPTKYRIKVHQAKENFLLNFSESYHQQWKAYVSNLPIKNFKTKFLISTNITNNFTSCQEEGCMSNDNIKNNLNLGLISFTGDKFISKINQGTIQNNNLPKGKIWETWFQEYLPDNNHFQTNGFANSWWLNIEELKKQNKITQNQNETYDFEIILEFWPQRLFHLGLLISIITLLSCLGYLGRYYYKNKKNKTNKLTKPLLKRPSLLYLYNLKNLILISICQINQQKNQIKKATNYQS